MKISKGFIIIGTLTPLICLLMVLMTNFKADEKEPETPPIQPSPQVEPGSGVAWTDFQPRKDLSDPSWGEVLTDIENHLDPSYGTQYRSDDKDTWAHETTHGVHAWMNNNLQNSRTHYYLYVGKNKAAAIRQPKYTIKDVSKMVPKSLQKSRYRLYLIDQQSGWNDEPVYLWDEWVAYCNGAECGIELKKKGLYSPNKNDSCWGVLEFNVYAAYVAMAQKKHDPSYENKQMMEFLAWNLRRGMEIYKDGQTLDCYNWDDGKYLEHLTTSEEASEFRKFLVDNYGADWTFKVFGFK